MLGFWRYLVSVRAWVLINDCKWIVQDVTSATCRRTAIQLWRICSEIKRNYMKKWSHLIVRKLSKQLFSWLVDRLSFSSNKKDKHLLAQAPQAWGFDALLSLILWFFIIKTRHWLIEKITTRSISDEKWKAQSGFSGRSRGICEQIFMMSMSIDVVKSKQHKVLPWPVMWQYIYISIMRLVSI